MIGRVTDGPVDAVEDQVVDDQIIAATAEALYGGIGPVDHDGGASAAIASQVDVRIVDADPDRMRDCERLAAVEEDADVPAGRQLLGAENRADRVGRGRTIAAVAAAVGIDIDGAAVIRQHVDVSGRGGALSVLISDGQCHGVGARRVVHVSGIPPDKRVVFAGGVTEVPLVERREGIAAAQPGLIAVELDGSPRINRLREDIDDRLRSRGVGVIAVDSGNTGRAGDVTQSARWRRPADIADHIGAERSRQREDRNHRRSQVC